MKFSNLLPDLSFPRSSLLELFQKHHERYLQAFPGWSVQSTRRKLAAFYWLKIVLRHYLVLVSIASVFALFITHQPGLLFFQALIPASMLIFVMLFVSMYWPMYQLEFLLIWTLAWRIMQDVNWKVSRPVKSSNILS